MFNLQGSEIIVILLVALVVLGPEKLPDAVRRASRTYHELKKMGTGFQSELKAAIDEPMREMRETADLVRDAADPRKLAEYEPSKPAVVEPAPGESEPAATGPADEPVETASDATSDTASDTVSETASDDEVMGEMWEDDPALDPGSHTVGIPPHAVDATDDDSIDRSAQ